VEGHPDVWASSGADRGANRTRLGLLHHGDGPTQVHERRPQVQRGPERDLVVSAVHLHVVGVHGVGLDVRFLHQKAVPVGDLVPKTFHHDWYLPLHNTHLPWLYTHVTASMGPAIFIIAASYSGCDRDLAVGMFTIAMSFMGTFYCGMKVNALDLAPNFAGTLMAIVNGIGAITGIIVPYLVGALTEDVIIDTLSLSPH
jgi:hypothetical protein